MGVMKLTQQGTYIRGTINQDGKEYAIEGSISNGIFKGNIQIPSESNALGGITSFEMNMSSHGKSINFQNIGGSSSIKNLNGTKALKQ